MQIFALNQSSCASRWCRALPNDPALPLVVATLLPCLILFFFNDTATTEIYTLSLHDALPICLLRVRPIPGAALPDGQIDREVSRSEEHTSELQSPCNLVCRLLLENKDNKRSPKTTHTKTSIRRAARHIPDTA